MGMDKYQIILGEHLFNVYDNIVKNYSVETEDAIDENLDEDLVQSSEKKNFKYYFSKVILFMGQAMTPFITVVYGSRNVKSCAFSGQLLCAGCCGEFYISVV